MPVEALAAGGRVIANSVGGASESVTPGVDGVLFSDDRWESIVDAIQDVQSVGRNTHRPDYDRFSVKRFESEVKRWVEGER